MRLSACVCATVRLFASEILYVIYCCMVEMCILCYCGGRLDWQPFCWNNLCVVGALSPVCWVTVVLLARGFNAWCILKLPWWEVEQACVYCDWRSGPVTFLSAAVSTAHHVMSCAFGEWSTWFIEKMWLHPPMYRKEPPDTRTHLFSDTLLGICIIDQSCTMQLKCWYHMKLMVVKPSSTNCTIRTVVIS